MLDNNETQNSLKRIKFLSDFLSQFETVGFERQTSSLNVSDNQNSRRQLCQLGFIQWYQTHQEPVRNDCFSFYQINRICLVSFSSWKKRTNT